MKLLRVRQISIYSIHSILRGHTGQVPPCRAATGVSCGLYRMIHRMGNRRTKKLLLFLRIVTRDTRTGAGIIHIC